VAQEVELLPTKYKALSSNPNTTKILSKLKFYLQNNYLTLFFLLKVLIDTQHQNFLLPALLYLILKNVFKENL
jgi:hypothetical protein